MQRFISELQRRKVLRVASAYVVAGWIVLQVSATLEGTLNLPSWFDTAIFAVLATGLPVALVLAWTFDITAQGVRRTTAEGDGRLVAPATMDVLLAGMLLVVIAVAIAQAFVPPSATVVAEAPASPANGAQEADPKSIAVLPFVNLSTDKDNEYFADGLTEEILNVLAQLRDLKVISRTSSFSFKGKNTPVPEIARQLGVRHILEGSVRRSGEDVRVTAQLIDVTTDVHLWSQTYDRKIEKIFAVQDEIAIAIASAMNLHIDLATPPRDAPTSDVEAYRVFLRARELFRQRGEHTVMESIDLYKKAIARDPDFAEAHAGLAASYTSEGSKDKAKFAVFAPLATKAAEKAMSLKPKLAQPYAVLGSIACDRLQWTAAFDNGNKAVAYDPSDSTALLWLGLTQLAARRVDAATRTLDQAARLDPLYTFIHIWRLRAAYARNDDTDGRAIAEKLLGAGAEASVHAHWYLASVAREQGDAAAAEKHFRAAMKGAANADFVEAIVGAIKSPDAMEAARKAIEAEAARDPTFAADLLLLLIGDTDGFFDLVDRAYVSGDTTRVTHMLGLAWRLPQSAWARSSKARPLLKKAGLVAYWKKSGAPDKCRGKDLEDFECG